MHWFPQNNQCWPSLEHRHQSHKSYDPTQALATWIWTILSPHLTINKWHSVFWGKRNHDFQTSFRWLWCMWYLIPSSTTYQIQNNSLATFWLTTHENYIVNINKNVITSIQTTMFISEPLHGDMILLNEHAHSCEMQTINKQIWHHRLGHIGINRLNCLIKDNMADGLTISSSKPIPNICKPSIVAKQHWQLFPKNVQNCLNLPLQLSNPSCCWY